MPSPKYFIVGGYVRDSFLDTTSHDIDFAVEAESYDSMKHDLIKNGIKIYLETPAYFTIRGSHPKFGGVDYVLCRKDGDYVDGRHPETVLAGTIMDDLARRDFTINAMAYDEEIGTVIDPFGGQNDLQAKLIRTVGDPNVRFKEDALRILRAIRFSIKLGFTIERETYRSMVSFADTIMMLPLERIREELNKCFMHNTIATIRHLESLGIMNYIFANGDGGLWLMPTNRRVSS